MKIKNAEYLKKYIIRFEFDNGYVREIDFEPFLRVHKNHKAMGQYLDIEKFKQFKNEKYCISWANDMDFHVQSLFSSDWSEEQVKKNREKLIENAIKVGLINREDL
jgi:hypothetical protein